MADSVTSSQESTIQENDGGVDIAQLLLHGIDLKALGLEISDIESIEIGTAKGSDNDMLHDVANQLQKEINNTQIAPEGVCKATIESTVEKEEQSLQTQHSDSKISGNSKTRELEDLVRDFKSSIESSGWLKENTVEKMQQENPELIAQVMEMKEKQRNGEEIEIPEDFKIISADSGPTEDNELTSLMSTLYHQIKSSNWLEEQNKSLAASSKSAEGEAESLGACAAHSNTDSTGAFELMLKEIQSVPGKKDDISELMNELQHSIRTSPADFLELDKTDSLPPKK